MQNLQTDNKPIYDNVTYGFPADWPSEDFEKVLIKNLPGYKKFKRKEISPLGKIPVIDQGSEVVAGYINSEADKYSGDLPIIIFGDHTRNVKYIDFDFAVGADGTKLLKPKEELLEKFFYYYLKSIFIPPSGYSRHYKYLKEIKVPVPEKNIQRSVIGVLDKLLPQAQAQAGKINKAKQYILKFRQAILSAAISGKLTERWREKNLQKPVSEIVNNLKTERLQNQDTAAKKKKIESLYKHEEENNTEELPEGWSYVALDKLCESFQYGTSKKSDSEGKVPVLRMGNLQNGEIDWGSLVFTSDASEIEKYKLEAGNVLFNRTNSPELVGKTSIYRGERPAIFAGYLIKVNNFPVLNSEYLNYCLNSQHARNFCFQVKTDGVSQSNINAQKLGKFEVPFCSPEEQEEIVKQVDKYFDVANQAEKQIEKAEARVSKLTQAILAITFRGE